MKKTILFLGLLMMLAVPMVSAGNYVVQNASDVFLQIDNDDGDSHFTYDVYARNFFGNASTLSYPTCADGESLTYNGTDLYCDSGSGLWKLDDVGGNYIKPDDNQNVSIRGGGYFEVKDPAEAYNLIKADPATNITTIGNNLIVENFNGTDLFNLNANMGGGVSGGGTYSALDVFFFMDKNTYFGLPSSISGTASGNITIFSDASDAYAFKYVDDGSLAFGISDIEFEQGFTTTGDIILDDASITSKNGTTTMYINDTSGDFVITLGAGSG